MLQISLFLFVTLSFFLVVAVPLYFTVWGSGKKIVFSALTAWVGFLGLTGFLNSVV